MPTLNCVSTHSRAKAAEYAHVIDSQGKVVSTHSRAKAADQIAGINCGFGLFQHTAARRRLTFVIAGIFQWALVSTHSRAKAADLPGLKLIVKVNVSTHSRAKAAESLTCQY